MWRLGGGAKEWRPQPGSLKLPCMTSQRWGVRGVTGSHTSPLRTCLCAPPKPHSSLILLPLSSWLSGRESLCLGRNVEVLLPWAGRKTSGQPGTGNPLELCLGSPNSKCHRPCLKMLKTGGCHTEKNGAPGNLAAWTKPGVVGQTSSTSRFF